MGKIVENKKCFLCKACVNRCPKKAISFNDNDAAFSYPVIQQEKCIRCNVCQRKCPALSHNFAFHTTLHYYIAQHMTEDIIKQSSSGGMFSAFAEDVINQGGVVFGASYDKTSQFVRHISVTKIEDLARLRGSKYVQSDIGYSYKEAEHFLKENRVVLFSGTPCQIAGLKMFLGKDYSNLITVDLICQGTPSADIFQSYLHYFEKKHHCKVIDFKFRDQRYGWGKIGSIVYLKGNRQKVKVISYANSSFYDYSSKAMFYKESCYTCPFAQEKRVGDITLGDFWGIANYKPAGFQKKGISVLFTNTQAGDLFFEKVKTKCHWEKIEKDIAFYNNGNLMHPTKRPIEKGNLIKIYNSEGYQGLDKFWKRSIRFHKKYWISPKIKWYIKKILKER